MHPQDYTSGVGEQTAYVTPLLWFTLVVSVLVCLIISALVWRGATRRAIGASSADLRSVPVERREGGVRWIWIGVAVSMVPLLITLFWTVGVLAKIGPIPRTAPLAINITAKQWWWDAEYEAGPASERFHTANEIHIPINVPVLVRLKSADVIHSFWVPKVAGKMDVIPGQTNTMWIQANKVGRYRGQCAEFCGSQHAHMAFVVAADLPADYAAWRANQLRPAPAPVGVEQQHGLEIAESRCSLCHAIRGTRAASPIGPDLTHLKSRSAIGAGTLPNTLAALSGWIENPQGPKPGARMPAQTLSGPDLTDLTAYLETLR
ncbi:cytochrome c oxidase subunit II [Sphingomonas ginkgonis]|uniref:Cytochrome aa3 subunit 2 n=1 Tax=Sphingomonas ginkgonis TaxID=2315330 RepID=A0A3R9YN18_9SPHN|nr:cytochrome c oxidase subunit II [Sphingomonas ginkgonis]RST31242.1 cytochrome c oxidase subunit II [Sphingomonas ginkgonis]